MIDITKIAPGDDVWVVEHDECGELAECAGYMLLAASGDYAILSPWINNLETAEDTLAYHAKETADNCETDLAVFQLCDCYPTLDDARDGLKAAEGIS